MKRTVIASWRVAPNSGALRNLRLCFFKWGLCVYISIVNEQRIRLVCQSNKVATSLRPCRHRSRFLRLSVAHPRQRHYSGYHVKSFYDKIDHELVTARPTTD